MKHLICLITFFGLLFLSATFAQQNEISLPQSTIISHFRLAVSYNTTTVLVFGAAVKPVDRGNRDIIAQKQNGVENVLKLKAGRKNFLPTNLHVFTADGRIYAFDLFYTDSLATTRNLTTIIPEGETGSQPEIFLTQQPVNSIQMEQFIKSLKALPSEHTKSTHHFQMKLELERIGLADHLLFFRFQITNLSNLDYSIDFVRLYIRDRQKAKRSSIQEIEILPVYQDTAYTIVGNSSIIRTVVVPAFTLADNKQFVVELFEKNGGRSVTLKLKNKSLFKAKHL